MSRAPSILLVTLICALAGCAPAAEPDPIGAHAEALRDLDAIENRFLDLLNEYRVSFGLGTVQSERALADGALQYSRRMGQEGFFDHVSPDGTTFDSRMCDAGYEPACGPSTYIAENIAAGQETAEEVFEAWRTSPGHDANMRTAEFRVVGIGRAVVSGSPYGVYWTNTFGGEVTSNTVPLEPPPVPDAGPPPASDAGRPPPVLDGGGGLADAGMPPPGGGGGRRRGGCAGCAVESADRDADRTAALAALGLLAVVSLVVARRRRG